MIRRALLFFVLLIGALVTQAPAWLMDEQLNQFTRGAVRLTDTQGSLWQGSGTLTVIDPVKQRAQPWLALQWRWQPLYLLRGEMAWRLLSNNNPVGEVAVGINGWRADELALSAPARFAMERIPHAFGRLGWQGDMSLTTTQWRCDWQARCTGQAGLRWTGVAADILMGRPIGDYQLELRARDGNIDLNWRTLGGATQIVAQGALHADRHWNLAGTIQGEPEFVNRLPTVANQWVRPTGQPGTFAFNVGG